MNDTQHNESMKSTHVITYCLFQCDNAIGDDHPARYDYWTDQLCKELYQLNEAEFDAYVNRGEP